MVCLYVSHLYFSKLLGYHVHTHTHVHTVHLHHETTQCFIKQARDFCILVSERSEVLYYLPSLVKNNLILSFSLVQLNKKLLVGVSIESPDCPINPNLHRGKVRNHARHACTY